MTLLATMSMLAACSVPATTGAAGPVTHDYRPGLAAYPHLPRNVEAAPVVVLVPGGGWTTADPAGLAGLAERLAASGVVAVPVVVRAEVDGVLHPVPLEDVVCALADAVATSRAAGIRPTRAVLLGHSSGAHLAALVALDPDAVPARCEDPVVAPDALVGLAGPYDIGGVPAAEALVGSTPEEDPATWRAANPVFLATRRPDLPVLLVHGDADDVVPPEQTRRFGSLLLDAGHDATVSVLPGVDHDSVYSAEVVGDVVVEWLRDHAAR